MKKLILLVSFLLIAGCNAGPAAEQPATSNQWWGAKFTVQEGESKNWEDHVVIIDKCEYLFYGQGHDEKLTHKGNCSNPVHIYNKIK